MWADRVPTWVRFLTFVVALPWCPACGYARACAGTVSDRVPVVIPAGDQAAIEAPLTAAGEPPATGQPTGTAGAALTVAMPGATVRSRAVRAGTANGSPIPYLGHSGLAFLCRFLV